MCHATETEINQLFPDSALAPSPGRKAGDVLCLRRIIVGVALALAAGEAMRGMLHGVEPHDSFTLVVTALTVGAAARV